MVDEIAPLCVPLIDTIPTCTIRWAQLPPALEILDQVFQKLNQTLKDADGAVPGRPERLAAGSTSTPTRSSRTTA